LHEQDDLKERPNMAIIDNPTLERLLNRLHRASDAQTEANREHRAEREKAGRPTEAQATLTKTLLADKLYALDRDKAEFCYHLCRAIDAHRVVELGTPYGV
jgi:predicted O-methyltransferase YrrM